MATYALKLAPSEGGAQLASWKEIYLIYSRAKAA